MMWDPSIDWNVRNSARRHRVSPATVQRVWKKYGIRMVRPHQSDHGVDLQTLKISQDPLFGVTVYELAGLFFENVGPVLAICSRERAFAELRLSNMSKQARTEMVSDLIARLRILERRNVGRETPASKVHRVRKDAPR